jgi:hypothetical protein
VEAKPVVPLRVYFTVMAVLVTAIQVFDWIPGTTPGVTVEWFDRLGDGVLADCVEAKSVVPLRVYFTVMAVLVTAIQVFD